MTKTSKFIKLTEQIQKQDMVSSYLCVFGSRFSSNMHARLCYIIDNKSSSIGNAV